MDYKLNSIGAKGAYLIIAIILTLMGAYSWHGLGGVVVTVWGFVLALVTHAMLGAHKQDVADRAKEAENG